MAQPTTQAEKGWELRYMIGFFGCLIVAIVVVVAAFQQFIKPIAIWFILLVLLIAMTLFLSRAYSHRWLGIIIDDRRKYSLSRLQMVMWTVIILSSFVAAVLSNVQLTLLVYIDQQGKPGQVIYADVGWLVQDALLYAKILKETDVGLEAIEGVDLSSLQLAAPLHDGEVIHVPLSGEDISITSLQAATRESESTSPTTPISIAIPSEVWLLLGISTTSLVASPLIKGQKKGKIQNNDSSSEAKFSDLFRGEEGSNYTTLDLAKTQMFYFTLIIIGAYMIAVASMFLKNSQNAIVSLPALDSGVVAMLGVSHAGYLTNKAIPHSDGDSTDGDAGGNTATGDSGAGTDTTIDDGGAKG